MNNKLNMMSMVAGALFAGPVQGVEETAGFFASYKPRVRETKEFTHFDQERLDKAEQKRVRKAATRLATN